MWHFLRVIGGDADVPLASPEGGGGVDCACLKQTSFDSSVNLSCSDWTREILWANLFGSARIWSTVSGDLKHGQNLKVCPIGFLLFSVVGR